uniref:Cilia- and flagella-associated protein 58 central coiled coil domain-containing protein n=1 Tax=Chromera velia CCMP2878 TaxID=1169474 RepID=A0A0K6S8L3_9ALVE|eukprot:Cvel_6247.t1-p1 / transcript=Cvel_6247.t1 / gene=Cvel_6247 / organism=Chromera_velia_CCMP2878 / gene_product=Coiled-coil domain-containing protein 147, putative / transcript_product=Coiled-coil domain-containing protein 147, putative / location=Cvel_scaffold302:74425-84233(+) / protein_length=853 / sequence_SO=supercontig / SO=protein_coding / is_pseudo=false
MADASAPTGGVDSKDKTKIDEAFESTAFEALEKDFQEVLQELLGDKSLEHFRLEYEKLHRALKKSHESERRLIKKCRELNAEIVTNAAKVQTALKLSQEDQATISALKKEIERAWKMVEASHEKEQRAKDTIHSLKIEIANLSRLVEQGAGLSINQENTVNDLIRQRDELVKEREMLNSTVVTLSAQSSELFERVQKLQQERIQSDAEIHNMKDLLNTRRTEAERDQRKKELLDRELKELRANLERSHSTLHQRQMQLEEEIRNKQKLEETNGELDAKLKEEIAHSGALDSRVKERNEKLNAEVSKNRKLEAENQERAREVQERTEEIGLLNTRLTELNKKQDALRKKLAGAEDEKKQLETQRHNLLNDVQAISREIESLKKHGDADKKQIEDLLRERDILNKNVIKADASTKKHIDLVKRHKQEAVKRAADILRYKHDAQENKKRIYELEKQKEKYAIELSQANSKYIALLEELKTVHNKLEELKKHNADCKTRLNQQKNLYEQVRTDRNLYSKNLIESQDEIAEMRRKYKIMYHNIEQLKEEIKEKDSALIKEHFEKNRVAQENEKIRDELNRATKKMSSLQTVVDNQKSVISERDILGTQLIRRNDELALLYEKIKIQQSTLQKGEIQYQDRLEDIRGLQRKIALLKREVHFAKQQVTSIEDLKREVYHLQRDLLQERTKVKALSEELENPMNVHRWRKLEGADPATYEMVQKVKTLQRRLIQKTEEVVEKDLQIQEKEKLYVELKNILARQPGPEVAEQLTIYQQNMKDKTKQMKAMASELNMYHAQVGEYKDEIERLTRDMQDLKRKYFETKKKEMTLRDTNRPDASIKPQMISNQQKFTGGGFNLSV